MAIAVSATCMEAAAFSIHPLLLPRSTGAVWYGGVQVDEDAQLTAFELMLDQQV